MTDAKDKARMYWRCRRGMLELDLLLTGFFEREYDRLNVQDREVFRVLLECPDQELFEYLLGKSVPRDGAMNRVVEKIRHTAAH